MNNQKFYYGEDIIEKQRQYQFGVDYHLNRSTSEKKRNIKLITKSSTSPITKSQLNALKNITEFNQSLSGQDQIKKRRTMIFSREPQQQGYTDGLISSQSKIRVIRVPQFKKIQTSSQSIPIQQNAFDSEQQFLLSLFQKDQNIDKNEKFRAKKIIVHHHQKSSQSEVSLDRASKFHIPTQGSFRRESQKDLKDRKQTEQKQFSYKLALALHYTQQIIRKENKLENFLDNEQKFAGFMNFTYNLTNLPLNIQGLEHMFQAPKYLLKTLKPNIPQNLEKLLFEDEECVKFRILTFPFQLFYILFNQSELLDILTNSIVKFITKQPKEYTELYSTLERHLLNNSDFHYMEQQFEKVFNQNYETCLNEAKSFYTIQIDYEYVKQLYCFCIKVQEALRQRIVHEGNKKQTYDKGFDFKEALKKIKSKDVNQQQLFIRFLPQKHEVMTELEKFEQKFGRIDTISNIQREQAKLADMKHNVLYEKILSLQKQIE